jgi:hypothetical protein
MLVEMRWITEAEAADRSRISRASEGDKAGSRVGANPTELPVQQVVKVELIINLRTTKALGLTIPFPLLGRTNEVIEWGGGSS